MDPKVQEALNTIVAALGAETPTEPTPPWWRNPGPVPTEPVSLTDEPALKNAIANGLKADLKRGVAVSDFSRALGVCDQIAAAKSPAEADAVISGAGHFSPDTSIYLVLAGATQGTGLFQSPSIFAPWGAWDGIPAAAAYVTNQPNPNDPGPGY